MRRVENIEDRVDHILQQVIKSGQRRDALLDEVASLVREHPTLAGDIDAIQEVRYRQLPQYAERGAQLARTIEASAALAERSSRKVKRLAALHARVQAAKTVAESMIAMRETIAEIPVALAAEDLDKTVALLTSYEEARQQLGRSGAGTSKETENEASADSTVGRDGNRSDCGTKGPSTSSLSSSFVTSSASAARCVIGCAPPVDSVVIDARRIASEKLINKAKSAMAVNDKLTIMNASQLLAQLGMPKEGRELYCNWMCDHTIRAIQKMVERELSSMSDPTKATKSHLALVSEALDGVAVAYETEEAYTRASFGHEGPLLLLTLLHQRCTAACVPVLRDFIERRSGALTTLQQQQQQRDASSGGRGFERRRRRGGAYHRFHANSKKNNSGDNEDEDEDEDDSENEDPEEEAADLLGLLDDEDATRGAADARRADQTLEETGHLVSCCHVYLNFAEAKREEHVNALKQEAEREAAIPKSAAASGAIDDTLRSSGDGNPSPSKDPGERTPATTTTTAAADAVSAADRLWSSDRNGGGSNALLSAVQEILSMYVPLQMTYFDAAFRQALQLQLQTIRSGIGHGDQSGSINAGRSTLSGSSGRKQPQLPQRASSPSPLPVGSPVSLMAGITSMYTAAVGGSDGSNSQLSAAIAAALEAENRYYMEDGTITLPDDVFFFLRIAVHRAINTKSTQIASAVIMAATDVIQSQLVVEVSRRADMRKLSACLLSGGCSGDGGNGVSNIGAAVLGGGTSTAASQAPLPTPRALRWACAGRTVSEYCKRLAQELRTITTAGNGSPSSSSSSSSSGGSFSSRDLIRFRELAQDLEMIARDVSASESAWMRQGAKLCVAHIQATSTHAARLASLSYNITEESFYHYELNDPWVQSFLNDWASLLNYVAAHLYEPTLFDALLVEIARSVAKWVREALMKSLFSTFGALQADKDVRALREFFFQRAHDVSALREVFAPLSLLSTLLLCDAPRDALEESRNTALTPEEKRAVLLLRVDFKKQDVVALRL